MPKLYPKRVVQMLTATVIIPAHNRPDRLTRIIDYYLHESDFNIIISDSSNEKHPTVFDHPRIKYFHYPKTDLALKIFYILDEIETSYVFMCADDDFIVPDAVKNIITFLDANKNYNSGQGLYLRFEKIKNRLAFYPIYQNVKELDLTLDAPAGRLRNLMANYHQYYYAVFRTDTFNEVYSGCIYEGKTLIRNLCLLELYVSILSAIRGKHYLLNSLYSAREFIANSAGAVTDRFTVIRTRPEYKNEYNDYLVLLVNKYCDETSCSYNDAVITIQAIHDIYLEHSFDTSTMKAYRKKILTMLGLNSTAKKIKSGLKAYMHKSTRGLPVAMIKENATATMLISQYVLNHDRS